MKIKVYLRVLALLALAVPTVGFSNVDDTWNMANGNWSTAANWSTGQIPGPGTNAILPGIVTSGLIYSTTNDLVNLTIGDLTMTRPAGALAAGTIGLTLGTTGFEVAGNALVGKGGSLNLNGFSMLVGGLMQTTNGGVVSVAVNGSQLNATNGFLNGGVLAFTAAAANIGTVNVGGIDQASSMVSAVTMTNAAAGLITFGSSSAGGVGVLNASTSTVGFVNFGTLSNFNTIATLNVNALFINEIGGRIAFGNTSGGNSAINIWAMPTNRGTINISVGGSDAVNILNGDVVNQGTITHGVVFSAGGFSVLSGTFINDTNGTYSEFGNTSIAVAPTIVNRGTITIYNNDSSLTSSHILTLANTLTNEASGTLLLTRVFPLTSGNSIMKVSNLFNQGTITASGLYNGLTNSMSLIRFSGGSGAPTTAITNQIGGVFNVTNGAAVGMLAGQFRNDGTVRVFSNSTFGVGIAGNSVPSSGLILGTASYANTGTISLFGGAFGASVLSNAAGATVGGYGDVGQITYTNLISGTVTNFARIVTPRNIVNFGTIAPSGVFNAGAITNTGWIIGSGVIQSLSTTNLDNGIITVSNTGAQIHNNPGGTILASIGTLVLSNRFLANSQAGTIGTTQGGTLQLGDGITSLLTNNGIVSLGGGALTVGNLVNNGTILGTGTVQSAAVINAGLISPGNSPSNSPGTLVFSSDLTLVASSLLNLELAGATAGSYDRIVVNGNFTLDGTLTITNLSPYTPAGGATFDLFDFTSPLVGTFSVTNLPTLSGGLFWDFSQFDSQGILAVTMIPEPSVLALLLFGALAARALAQRYRGRSG